MVLTPEQEQIRDMLRDFAREQLAPKAAEWDKTGHFPREELREPRYLSQPSRYADREHIDAVIQEELLQDTAENWLAKLRAARIPCAPVNDFAQALSDPQVLARNMVIDVPLQNGEVVRMPGNPVKIGDAPSREIPGAPPMLGEHTETVLRTVLGYDDARMDHLRQNSVIQ